MLGLPTLYRIGYIEMRRIKVREWYGEGDLGFRIKTKRKDFIVRRPIAYYNEILPLYF